MCLDIENVFSFKFVIMFLSISNMRFLGAFKSLLIDMNIFSKLWATVSLRNHNIMFY